jgi:transcriptional regulator with XRE-family HTH domain
MIIDPKKLKRILYEKNFRQRDLAKKIGVSESHISRILNAEELITVLDKTGEKLASALGVSSEVFMSCSAYGKGSLTPAEKTVLEMYRALDPCLQAKVLLHMEKTVNGKGGSDDEG